MIPIKDTVPARSAPFAVYGLIAINVVVFLLELTLGPEGIEVLFHTFGVVPARYAGSFGLPEVASMLTSQFLHSGWLHLIGNLWVLWIFGDNVEDRLGSTRFVVFYLICGVAAALTHVLTTPGSTVPAVGASGAIAGVTGAYLLMFPTARVIVVFPVLFIPFFFEVPAVVFLGVWYMTQVFGASVALAGFDAAGGLAWWAHVGGFLCGVLLGWPFARTSRRWAERRAADDERPLEAVWGR